METKYAVIIENEAGEKQVVTQDITGKPFDNATAAQIHAEKMRVLFPEYKYDWAPVRGC